MRGLDAGIPRSSMRRRAQVETGGEATRRPPRSEIRRRVGGKGTRPHGEDAAGRRHEDGRRPLRTREAPESSESAPETFTGDIGSCGREMSMREEKCVVSCGQGTGLA